MFLYFNLIYTYELYNLTNKKLLIHSIPYTNFIIAENISDFSDNIFHSKNLTYNLKEFNKISYIEKIENKYRIKIGNFYVCHNPKVFCNYNSDTKICTDEKFNSIDCITCRNKSIQFCKSKIDLWNIEKSALGYIIKNNDMCFTLGFKLYLDTCKDNKNQLFGFEDYDLKSCIENFNPEKIPITQKEIIDNLKMKQKLTKNIKTKKLPANDKSVDKKLEDILPEIKNKKKMKKLWGNLWKYGFGGLPWPKFKINLLCTKWW